jgi:integrase
LRYALGIKTKSRAELFVVESIKQKKTDTAHAEGLTLRDYAERYFIWETCPHVGRLVSERKSITRRHVKEQRALLDRNFFTDALANMKISKIRRADILDFRTRLLKRIGEKIRTVNKTIGALKTIFKEGVYREDLDRNPVVGIGDIKYKQREIGTFTMEELKTLFPSDSTGPWKGIQDYTCFLLAATAGMRKAEILALRWENINFEKRFIKIDTAWKSRDELGLPKWDRVRVTPILLFADLVISRLRQLHEQSIRIAPEDLVFC